MDINFTQARHAQQMFAWYVHEHLSVSQICRRLEAMAIPSPSGQIKWTVTTVSRMLRNPHYKGCASFGKWRNGQKMVVSQKPVNGKVSRTKLPSLPSDVYSCFV